MQIVISTETIRNYAYIDSFFNPISCIKCKKCHKSHFFSKLLKMAVLQSCNLEVLQPNACWFSGKSGLDTREAGRHTYSTVTHISDGNIHVYITLFSFRYAIQVSPLRIAHRPCSIVILSILFVNGMPGGMSIGLPATPATGSLSSRFLIALI